MILKRKTYNELLIWKEKFAPSHCLFIKGAIRVGKTTLAETFGKTEYKSYITVNFQEANDVIKDLFVNQLLDLDYLYSVLERNYNTKLFKRESLIILDEIQLFPKARQALKTLLKDGRYDFIETGSLAGISKKTRDEQILIPSEEHIVELHPLDFEEFLWACGDFNTMLILDKHYKELSPLKHLHKDILISFRKYMCVGGMPQAVVQYVKNKDFEDVHLIKEEILNLYRNDVKEQTAENSLFIDNIINSIPSQLSRHGIQDVKLFKANQVNSNYRLNDYKGPLNWLNEAMIVNIARCCSDPNPALTLTYNDKYIKCYMEDTGLLINLSFSDGTYMDNKFYSAILFDKLHINEGMFVENIIAQQLVSNGHKPVFYVNYKNNGKIDCEVDFIIRDQYKICPIEVRSGKKKSFKSLEKFNDKFKNRIRRKIVLHEYDLKVEDELIYLPYYFAGLL